MITPILDRIQPGVVPSPKLMKVIKTYRIGMRISWTINVITLGFFAYGYYKNRQEEKNIDLKNFEERITKLDKNNRSESLLTNKEP